jgi:hypothetical protein
MLSTVGLYNGIFCTLSNDSTMLELLGIDPLAFSFDDELRLSKALKIQKRSKPNNLIESLPIITFYTPGGERERKNQSVFNALFYFDIYTNDDVDLAHRIAARIEELFGDAIPSFGGGIETFMSKFVDAYETESDLDDLYSFCVQIEFSVSM